MKNGKKGFWTIPENVEEYGKVGHVAKRMTRLNLFSVIGKWKKISKSFKEATVLRKIILSPYYLLNGIAWTLTRLFLTVTNPFFYVGAWIVLLVLMPIGVDQTCEYDETIASQFVHLVTDAEKKEGRTQVDVKIKHEPGKFIEQDINNQYLHIGQKGALLFQASYHQLQVMMHRFPYWSRNDPKFYPQHWWDNSRNTQEGVWWSTKEISKILSDRITRFGDGIPQNKLTLAAVNDFQTKPDIWKWWVTDSEEFYEDGFTKMGKFEKLAMVNPDLINIKTDDLVAILEVIKQKAIGEPYGRLQERNGKIGRFELDDAIKYARGAAIPARDVLVVLRYAFADMLERGGLDNLDSAIDSLEAIINFHPWITTRGEGSLPIPDYRSKLSRYFSQVDNRLKDIIKSMHM